MDKLISTARKLDVFFKILHVMFRVAAIVCLVGMVIFAVALIPGLPEEAQTITETSLALGAVTLHLTQDCLPDFHDYMLHNGMMVLIALAGTVVGCIYAKTIRAILAPMKEGKPFHNEISKNLRKLGWLSLILAAGVQVMEAIELFTVAGMYHLDTLLISEKVTHVDVTPSFDLSVLIIPAVFFLLAYVFKYGEQLQTLSDETL